MVVFHSVYKHDVSLLDRLALPNHDCAVMMACEEEAMKTEREIVR